MELYCKQFDFFVDKRVCYDFLYMGCKPVLNDISIDYIAVETQIGRLNCTYTGANYFHLKLRLVTI